VGSLVTGLPHLPSNWFFVWQFYLEGMLTLSEVKWIKLLTEMFDDEKIKLIEAVPEADMILVIWVKLLTLAGKKNMNGYIFLTENIPYTDEMLSTLFNRPLNTIRLALDTFKRFGMINYNNEGQIKITNWEKHQNIDGLEKIREQNRLRQERFREKKLLPLNNPPFKEEKEIDKIRIDKNRGITLHNVIIKNGNKINFNYETKNWENITEEDIKDWETVNISCNIISELELMRQWLLDDKKRAKKHYRKFISGWINRVNKKGVTNGRSNQDNKEFKGSGIDKYKHLEEEYKV